MKVTVTPREIPEEGDLIVDSNGSIGIAIEEDKVVVLSFSIMPYTAPCVVPRTPEWMKFNGTITLSND